MFDPGRVNCVVLAGGRGTRLQESVPDRPKVMALVNGRPFIAYLLDQLNSAGLGRIIICTGYMAAEIERNIPRNYRGMEIIYSREDEILGTAGAVKNSARYFSGKDILVLNGDSFFEYDLRHFFQWHKKKKARISILLTEVENVNRYGRIKTDAQGRITEYFEKETRSQRGLINAGIYLITDKIVDNIQPDKYCSFENEIFPSHIGEGLYGCLQFGRFLDIGTPESYKMAGAFINDVTSVNTVNH